jgi:large subunit ribosomal protein L24
VDPKSKKPTRVGYQTKTVTKNGATKQVRVRVAKKSGEEL